MRSGRRRSFREFSEAMPSTSSCRRFRRRAVSCSVRSKSPRRFRAKKNFRLRNTLTHLVRFSIPRFENRTYLLSGAGGEMQFFLLRKIRRRTGNTPRGPFVQTCIRPFAERAPPPPCRRLRRCQRRPARRKTRSREAGIAVFNTSSATEQREQVPPETISAGQMLPGKKLLSAKRRSR